MYSCWMSSSARSPASCNEEDALDARGENDTLYVRVDDYDRY